jgi:hypothetical protein
MTIEINTNKFTAEEIAEIKSAIAIRALLHSREPVPATQEEFDAWCEKVIAENREAERKAEIAKQKRIERENQPGYKAKKNYKRTNTEIEKMKQEMKALERKIAYYEKKKAEYAEQYEAETGEKI